MILSFIRVVRQSPLIVPLDQLNAVLELMGKSPITEQHLPTPISPSGNTHVATLEVKSSEGGSTENMQ